jgi:hypothetical protein
MQDYAVQITVNGVNHGVNHLCKGTHGGIMFSDAYYSVDAEHGSEFHGDLCQMVAALIVKGHLQGGFLLGSQNHAVDFYAFED